MTLYIERFLELLLKNNNTPLTPDKIRYALSQIHSIDFENEKTGVKGVIESKLPEKAKFIYNVLSLPSERNTIIVNRDRVVPEFPNLAT